MARRNSRTPIWVWPLLLVLVVALAATATSLLREREAETSTEEVTKDLSLKKGDQVYLWVKSIQVTDQMPSGSRWDAVDRSPPDLWFEMTWRDTKIQTSSQVNNQMIAQWGLIQIGIDPSDLLGTLEVDPTQLIAVPLVRIDEEETLKIEVFDDDPMPLGNERVGTFEINIMDLQLGPNVVEPEPGEANGIRRLELHVLREPLPIAKIVELVNGLDATDDEGAGTP